MERDGEDDEGEDLESWAGSRPAFPQGLASDVWARVVQQMTGDDFNDFKVTEEEEDEEEEGPTMDDNDAIMRIASETLALARWHAELDRGYAAALCAARRRLGRSSSSDEVRESPEAQAAVRRASQGATFAACEALWRFVLDRGRVPVPQPSEDGRVDPGVILAASRSLLAARTLVERGLMATAAQGYDVIGDADCAPEDLSVLHSVVLQCGGASATGAFVDASCGRLLSDAEDYVLRAPGKDPARPRFWLRGIDRVEVPIRFFARRALALSRGDPKRRLEIFGALDRIALARRKFLATGGGACAGAQQPQVLGFLRRSALAASVTIWRAIDDNWLDQRSRDMAPPLSREVFGDRLVDDALRTSEAIARGVLLPEGGYRGVRGGGARRTKNV